MENSTKYCITAITCTLIIALAYMITNRYEHGGYWALQRDNWTGKIYTDTPKSPAQEPASGYEILEPENAGFEIIEPETH